MATKKKPTGIVERNGRYRAEVFDRRTNKRIYRTLPTLAAARAWRKDVQVSVKRGEVAAVSSTTVADAWEQWLEGARQGTVRARGGAVYRPSVLRSYRLAFEGRLLDAFGALKVTDVRRRHVQVYVDDLVGDGLAPQTVRNLATALRVLFKWCIRSDLIVVNPVADVALPSGGTARDRIAPPALAIELL